MKREKMRRTSSIGVVGACSLLVLAMSAASASAQSQTAQSAMVALTPDSFAYEIVGTITWKFNRGEHTDVDLTGTAMSYYTNAWNNAAPTVDCNGGGANGCVTAPATPAAPAPLPLELQQRAQADRCTFFSGGTLGTGTYTQNVTVNVNSPAPAAQRGNWKFAYTYAITPMQAVAPETAWTSEETGGSVNLGFSGFVASESYQKQPNNRYKYSFTMVDGGITRARDVSASLMNGSAALASLDLNNVDTNGDLTKDGLAVGAAVADFNYFANGGIFGNSAVFSALHAVPGSPTRKDETTVFNILTGNDAAPADNFAGNNNDLAAGNVHIGPYSGSFNGLTEAGTYTVVVAGSLKGNSSSADFGFSVTSNLIQIGGCIVP
jgi:hypothetical protein